MTEKRTTQVVAEVLHQNTPTARITQAAAEVLWRIPYPKLRTTQVVVEVIYGRPGGDYTLFYSRPM